MTALTIESLTSTVTLNNGVQMPIFGFGVFLSPAERTAQAVTASLEAGYRLLDTASAYKNERAVGEGLRAAGVGRDEIFVTTKAFPSQYGRDETARAVHDSLNRLGLDYLDLYLLHWPVPTDFAPTIEAYRSAERMLADGKIRAIGVSNFEPEHLDRLIDATGIVPAVNQVELHPFFTQHAVRDANTSYGITTEAWSPIGGAVDRSQNPESHAGTGVLRHPAITEIAAEHGKTTAQIVLRWHLQHDIVVIPKSVHAERIMQNADIFDFELAPQEMEQIDRLDTGRRSGADPATFTKDTFAVNVDDQ